MEHCHTMMEPVLVPVIDPLDIRTVWEHTPLDYFRYGEYPRFIRPVGAHQPRYEVRWKKVGAEPPDCRCYPL